MPQVDEITLTLPRDREFHRVAQLVLGGLAVRLELTIEMLEDLQLGLAPVDVAAELGENGDALNLGRILKAVVDEVKLDGDHVRLLKKIGSKGG
jgi:hypothetical protein